MIKPDLRTGSVLSSGETYKPGKSLNTSPSELGSSSDSAQKASPNIGRIATADVVVGGREKGDIYTSGLKSSSASTTPIIAGHMFPFPQTLFSMEILRVFWSFLVGEMARKRRTLIVAVC